MNQKETPRSSESFNVRRPPQVAAPTSQGKSAASKAATAKAPQSSAASSLGQGSQGFKASPSTVRAKSVPTHEQIAMRARAIWQAKGCKPGQDKENWQEAETQLKREMGAV